MSKELPPLPRAAHGELYSRSQMHIYGLARERAAYERAAKECQVVADMYGSYEAQKCVEKIRALGADK